MINNRLLLVDTHFKPETSVHCHLLLKITNDSFSYAVVGENNDQLYVLTDKQASTDIEADVKHAFKIDKFLSLNYAAVKVSVHTPNFIFVPHEWANVNQLEVYHAYLGKNDNIYTTNHEKLGFKTLFSFNKTLDRQLPEHALRFAQSAPLIALTEHLTDEALLIDFTAGSFNIIYINGSKIVFQNHFQIENVHEFNYFLLLIISQLYLEDTVPVYLQGIINEDDEHYNCLLKYFNQLYFFLPVANQNSDLLADMPKHYFTGLLALNLCE